MSQRVKRADEGVTRVPGMSPTDVAARYREYAANCIRAATELVETASKLALLDMARAWLDLADHVEKKAFSHYL